MKKSKKLLALLLAVLLLTALMPFSALAAALPFSDVPQDAWYYPVVREAYEKGVTNGVTRTTFEPNATVTCCSGKGLHLAMAGEPRGFSRVTAGFSRYDGEFRLPLVLAQASPIFHSSCEGKLGIALE